MPHQTKEFKGIGDWLKDTGHIKKRKGGKRTTDAVTGPPLKKKKMNRGKPAKQIPFDQILKKKRKSIARKR